MADHNGQYGSDSWLNCLCVFWINVFYFGYFRSLPVLFPVLLRDFNFTKGDGFDIYCVTLLSSAVFDFVTPELSRHFRANIIFIIAIWTACFSAFSVYFIVDYRLIILQSVLNGIGRSFVLDQGARLIQQHFDVNKLNTITLFTSGIAVSGVVFSITTYFLIEEYTVGGGCLILSALTLNAVLFAILITKPDDTSSSNNLQTNGFYLDANKALLGQTSPGTNDNNGVSLRKVVVTTNRNRLWIIVTGWLITMNMLNILQIFLVDIAHDKGVFSDEAYLLYSAYCLVEISTNVAFKSLNQLKASVRRWILMMGQILVGLVLIAIIFLRGSYQLLVAFISLSFLSYPALLPSGSPNFLFRKRNSISSRALMTSNLVSLLVCILLRPLFCFYQNHQQGYDHVLATVGFGIICLSFLWCFEPNFKAVPKRISRIFIDDFYRKK